MSVTYGSLVQTLVRNRCVERGKGDEFGCRLRGTLWTWMMFALFLSIFGYAVIRPLSIGNNPSYRTPGRMLVSLVIACVYAV